MGVTPEEFTTLNSRQLLSRMLIPGEIAQQAMEEWHRRQISARWTSEDVLFFEAFSPNTKAATLIAPEKWFQSELKNILDSYASHPSDAWEFRLRNNEVLFDYLWSRRSDFEQMAELSESEFFIVGAETYVDYLVNHVPEVAPRMGDTARLGDSDETTLGHAVKNPLEAGTSIAAKLFASKERIQNNLGLISYQTYLLRQFAARTIEHTQRLLSLRGPDSVLGPERAIGRMLRQVG